MSAENAKKVKDSKNIEIEEVTVLNDGIPVLSKEESKKETKEEPKEEKKAEEKTAEPKVEEKKEEPKVEAPKVETPKIEAPKIETPTVDVPKVEEPKIEAPLMAGFTPTVPDAPVTIAKPTIETPIQTPTPSFIGPKPSSMGGSLFNKPIMDNVGNPETFKSHDDIDNYYDKKNASIDEFCEKVKNANNGEREKAHALLNKIDAYENWRESLFKVPGVDDAISATSAPINRNPAPTFTQQPDMPDFKKIA